MVGNVSGLHAHFTPPVAPSAVLGGAQHVVSGDTTEIVELWSSDQPGAVEDSSGPRRRTLLDAAELGCQRPLGCSVAQQWTGICGTGSHR